MPFYAVVHVYPPTDFIYMGSALTNAKIYGVEGTAPVTFTMPTLAPPGTTFTVTATGPGGGGGGGYARTSTTWSAG